MTGPRLLALVLAFALGMAVGALNVHASQSINNEPTRQSCAETGGVLQPSGWCQP